MSAMNARLTDFERHNLRERITAHVQNLVILPNPRDIYWLIRQVKEETSCVFLSCREYHSGNNVAT